VLPKTLGQFHELPPDERDGHDRPADSLLASLDLLPKPHLLLRVEEGNAADLPEIQANRVLGAEALLGRLVVFLGAALVVVRRPRQVVVGLDGSGEVQTVKPFLVLVRGTELSRGLGQPPLGLGLSDSGHGHRRAAV
jgi:hypothetical protein